MQKDLILKVLFQLREAWQEKDWTLHNFACMTLCGATLEIEIDVFNCLSWIKDIDYKGYKGYFACVVVIKTVHTL